VYIRRQAFGENVHFIITQARVRFPLTRPSIRFCIACAVAAMVLGACTRAPSAPENQSGIHTLEEVRSVKPRCTSEVLRAALADSKAQGEVKGDVSDRPYVVAKLWEAKVYGECANETGTSNLSKTIEDMVAATLALESGITIAANSRENDLVAGGCAAAVQERRNLAILGRFTKLMANDQLARFVDQHSRRMAYVMVFNCGMGR
jgi:hypothetical protein